MDSGFPEGMGYYGSISEPGIGYYKLSVKEASKEPQTTQWAAVTVETHNSLKH